MFLACYNVPKTFSTSFLLSTPSVPNYWSFMILRAIFKGLYISMYIVLFYVFENIIL